MTSIVEVPQFDARPPVRREGDRGDGCRTPSPRGHSGVDRGKATASAKALIETRTVGPTLQSPQTDALTRSRSLGVGTHLTPVHRPSMPASDCWPPGTSTSARPGMASRHVIDDAFDPHDLSILVAAAKTTMGPAMRTKDGEASVAALGRASEDILGIDAHVAMRRTLRSMATTAARAVHRISPDIPGDGVGDIPGDDDDTRSQTPNRVPILHPVGGLFTHIVPREHSWDDDGKDMNRHGYWSAHVDKANVPEYDVSAVLYLSDGGGVDFDGGEFTFLDERGLRQVVLPRRNRLVVFSSGEENVHSVGVVTSGERTTLNLWLSRDKRVAAPNDD